MRFPGPLTGGVLVRRYKRFLADVELFDGTGVTAHCANTGSMMQVSTPGSRVMISEAANPARKTRWDWQLIEVDGRWAGINTAVPNILFREGFEEGRFAGAEGYDTIRMEVKYGNGSRADAVLTGRDGTLYVEAKNVTLVRNGIALFPDAATSRGRKHLEELIAMRREGHRCWMFFLSQRMEATAVGIAGDIDPDYAVLIGRAMDAGVEMICWRAHVAPEGITLDRELPFAPG